MCFCRLMRSFNYWLKGVEESGSFANAPIRRTLGLTGYGQVIGIADTGLDFRSGYFFDSKVPVVPDKAIIGHRKIVSYTTIYGDFADLADGHGTHGRHTTTHNSHCGLGTCSM